MENQIIGNSLFLTLIRGITLSPLFRVRCAAQMYQAAVIYCPPFSLNLYLKLLMRDLKLRHWGCLTINYEFPLLWISFY